MSWQYFLGIDGGASKTVGRLHCVQSGERFEGRAEPSSLTLGVEKAVAEIVKLAQDLCKQAHCSTQDIYLVCGLAGAGEAALNQQATKALSAYFGEVEVLTDAKTSAYGANLGEPVAVVALGTGSVAMTLDKQGRERQIGGWGLLVGDEGGGARLGVNAVSALLWELDIHAKPVTDTGRYLQSQLGQDADAILGWLRRATPTSYAALVPAILEKMEWCPLAQSLFQQHMQAVVRLIKATGDNLPVVLTGGLADISLKHLNEPLKSRVITARGTSLDGACLLAERAIALAEA
ncbi:BadF/BadG/BcrA/BcrD ATPase family protein [Aliiglaciecola sp. CAU 1673]|uniref:BadF/BadG/BcrA/BcrD ATPase family protein n=1 Tax=Aliiglaciecola sp. CAU 1673 TaxID=3032595 RepID=UPI0023DA447B|nr:BadF/BadG/BcrA/BcrD ATPase family protein [Aliiglaciecola sp. CAU 1673]MDF2176674.1 BadF/BadG/BcrA/BcrD ATPase family protein [Aliiglaciecola sp. CAU 1673]